MKKFEFVLFDLDGTLMDTSEGILKSVDFCINSLHFPEIPLSVKQSFIGPPIKDSLRKCYGLSEEEATLATEVFRNAYKEKFLLYANIYDGVFDLLDYLKKQDIKIGIATYKRDDYAKKLLDDFRLSPKCDFILGSDANNILTKGDIINLCLKNLGCDDYSKAVLIGDTKHDAMGAIQSKIAFIAVTYGFGFHTRADALEYAPVFVANNPMDIVEFL